MKLKTVQIRMFRNILDSTEVKIEERVTCLVGKNESGKSAFLNALWRVNPARTNPEFVIHENYPAWLEKRHRNEGVNQKEFEPVEIGLEWEPADVKAIEEKFGAGVVAAGAKLRLWKNYSNAFRWEIGCNEKQALKNFIDKNPVPAAEQAAYAALADFQALKAKLAADVEKSEDAAEDLKLLSNAQSTLEALLGQGNSFDDAAWQVAKDRLPEFFYFADYSKLPYSVKIQHVLKNDNLDDSDATARALLMLGGTEQEYILNPDYERRKRELENVANVLTDDVNEYWSQNTELRVQPDITQRTVSNQQGQESVLDELKLRIWDNRHSLSLPFKEHSAGFQLKVTVLVDSRKEGNQRLERMAKDGYLEKQRIILVGEVLGRKSGDIEDLFEEDEYLGLYNKAFGKALKAKDLKGHDPIVARIARHEGVKRFDHGRPADVLLRDREAVLPTLSEDTFKRFEDLFGRINKTLGR